MDNKEELMELKHEAWPGYRTAFYIVMAVFSAYLLIIYLNAPDGAPKSHHGHGDGHGEHDTHGHNSESHSDHDGDQGHHDDNDHDGHGH